MATFDRDRAASILASFHRSLPAGETPHAALDQLLEATGARATGLWRLAGDHLELVGFRAAPDMSGEIQRAFTAATMRVPLDRKRLGIVQAVLRRKSSPATRDHRDETGEGSATWLERFGADQSLAVPIEGGDRVLGVIAVSAPYRFDPGTATWELLERLGSELGPSMSSAAGNG